MYLNNQWVCCGTPVFNPLVLDLRGQTHHIMKTHLEAVPAKPSNINSKVVMDKTRSFIVADSYSLAQRRILSTTIDDVETEVSLKAYDNMEKDSTIIKCKRILITSVLSDDLQLAPGATEEQVGESEYDAYVEIMEFCERVIEGLDKPYRDTLEQQYGNALAYGNGVAEIEWEYRQDAPSTRPKKEVAPKGRLSSALSRFKIWFTGQGELEAADGGIKRPSLSNEKTRLMPASIKVKPRNATRFVVDDFMNVLGLVPAHNRMRSGLKFDEIVDREKFTVFTLHKKNEDPRGSSTYRPALNWYNLKTQIPAEMMRFILEESVPKGVGTMAENMPPFEFERDENGDVVYDDPDTKLQPRMLTGAESFRRQLEGFRSGSAAVIPYGAKLEPYKKGMTGVGDAELFNKMLKIINNETENSILLQTLAQSEGEHQARSASEQVAEVLYNLVFWTRWQLSMMTLFDLFSVAVKINFGEWALRYLPIVSLGDFVRRDWVAELEAISDAYFKGFIDDSQRKELMAWLNLPDPGPSRQEMQVEAAAKQDVNGQPVQPNPNRPDKQTGTKKRNDGNGTEKKNVKNANTRRGPVNFLGNDTRWFGRSKSHIRASR